MTLEVVTIHTQGSALVNNPHGCVALTIKSLH